MASELELANQALANLGEPALAAINASTPHGQHVVVLGPKVARDLLVIHPWTWARTSAILTRSLAAEASGFLYSYALPNDLLLGPQRVYEPLNRNFDIEDWRRQGQTLLTDAPDLAIHYTRTAFASPASWPEPEQALYVDALTHALALPITGSFETSQALYQRVYGNLQEQPRGGMVGKAISRDRQRDPYGRGVRFGVGYFVQARRG